MTASVAATTVSGLNAEYEVMNAEVMADRRRAELLAEYLDALSVVCPEPKLMPLDDEGKAPVIRSRSCSLGSNEARELLHTPKQAITAVQDGARGFTLYAGRTDHGTVDICFGDHDDLVRFPPRALPETLTVRTGSGGRHTTFLNGGGVRNAQGKGEMDGAGEIRAENWYVVLPGSIHPSGGVYHVADEHPIAELTPEDIPPGLRPASRGSSIEVDVDIDRDTDFDDGGLVNSEGVSLAECRDLDPKLDALLNTDYPDHIGTRDDSRIDAKLVWRLGYHQFDDQQIADIWRAYRWREKLKREDYIKRTVAKCTPDSYRWNYEDPVSTRADPPVPHRVWSRSAGTPDGRSERSRGVLRKSQTKCGSAIEAAFRNGDEILIEALPSMGKSYGVIQAAAATGLPITVLTERHDLYDQYFEWAEDHGLSARKLPALHQYCPTIAGDYGDRWRDKANAVYRSGVSPMALHTHAEARFRQPLPCDVADPCPYLKQWRFKPKEYDLLVGHYVHAWNRDLSDDRIVVFDEFTGGSFVEDFDGDAVARIVSAYCKRSDRLPFDNYTELIEQRGEVDTEEVLDWIDEPDLTLDALEIISEDSSQLHAGAPMIVYSLLMAEDLGNGWEYTTASGDLDASFEAARSKADASFFLLKPPSLQDAIGVVALDGTPAPELWRLVLDRPLEHEQVLEENERREYLADGLGLRVIQTSSAVKPYSGGPSVNAKRDAVLFRWVRSHEGRRPALITTKTALDIYEEENVLGPINGEAIGHYGNFKGSNKFKGEPIGIVAGSPHYGNDYVKRWGALAGVAVESNGEKGFDKSYGPFGDMILQDMREHEVLQAVLRFARGETDTTVFVHTGALPDWVPRAAHGSVEQWSEGMREIITVLRTGAESKIWETGEIAADPRVSTGKRNVLQQLKRLREFGLINGERGQGWSWYNPELDRLNDRGTVRFQE